MVIRRFAIYIARKFRLRKKGKFNARTLNTNIDFLENKPKIQKYKSISHIEFDLANRTIFIKVDYFYCLNLFR